MLQKLNKSPAPPIAHSSSSTSNVQVMTELTRPRNRVMAFYTTILTPKGSGSSSTGRNTRNKKRICLICALQLITPSKMSIVKNTWKSNGIWLPKLSLMSRKNLRLTLRCARRPKTNKFHTISHSTTPTPRSMISIKRCSQKKVKCPAGIKFGTWIPWSSTDWRNLSKIWIVCPPSWSAKFTTRLDSQSYGCNQRTRQTNKCRIDKRGKGKGQWYNERIDWANKELQTRGWLETCPIPR